MTNEIQKQMDSPLVAVHNRLNVLLTEKVKGLPSGFQKERFLQNVMIVLESTKDKNGALAVDKVDPNSVARTILQGAFLGLDFLSRECYAIMYGNTVNFQTDYKGEVKLAKKHSINPIKDIYSKLVREGDVFEELIINGEQSINFNPKPFNNGSIIGAFAVVKFKDGSMISESMSREEIQDVKKNYSKAMNSKAWDKSEGEMSKKTCLRRLCKHITLEFDTPDMKIAWDDSSGMDFKKPKPQVAKSSLDEPVIDPVIDIKSESVTEQKELINE